MEINDITYKIIGAIYEVYNQLGPGLLESVYEQALSYQLRKDGLEVDNQVSVPIFYDGEELETRLRIDILVEEAVIVELKSVAELAPVHFMQIDTYLRLSGVEVGLLVNFNTANIKDSIHRRINTSDPSVMLNTYDPI